MEKSIFRNPFAACTARDMSYDEVLSYWCSPFTFSQIEEDAIFNNLTPIFIQGARGSGKTMLLKYLSYYCQKKCAELKGEKDLVVYFSQLGSLGFYFRYKDDFGMIFKYIDCSSDIKNRLFLYYYELFISREIVLVMQDLLETDRGKYSEALSDLVDSLKTIFDDQNILNINDVVKKINDLIYELDQWIKDLIYIDNPEDVLNTYISEGIVRKILKCIRSSITQLKNIKFIIIIDEYENAHEYQRVLNTLIKQVDMDELITYRLGIRPGGMDTYKTNVGAEDIQIDRDFTRQEISFKDSSAYRKFLCDIANKRLKKINVSVDIKDILGRTEDLEKEAYDAIKDKKNKMKHFEDLKTIVSPKDYKSVVEALSYKKNPLLELLNILWLRRGKEVLEIKNEMEQFIKNKSAKSKYKEDYINKYKYQLVLLLLNIYKVRKKYYSFRTFAFLSSGAVNDFISLCRHTIVAHLSRHKDELFIMNLMIHADHSA